MLDQISKTLKLAISFKFIFPSLNTIIRPIIEGLFKAQQTPAKNALEVYYHSDMAWQTALLMVMRCTVGVKI